MQFGLLKRREFITMSSTQPGRTAKTPRHLHYVLPRSKVPSVGLRLVHPIRADNSVLAPTSRRLRRQFKRQIGYN
jgi:hypothetical protein